MRPEAEATKTSWRAALSFAAVVGGVHFALLLGVASLVHGREFTDDVPMHMRMVRAPLRPLAGLAGEDAQHPPLLGLTEALFAYPLQLLVPDYYAIRIAYLLYETLTAFLFWLLLQRLVPDAGGRLWPALALAATPMAWITTVVMAQDEVIAACLVTFVVWLHATGRDRAALLMCGVGVVAAKIFVFVPLVALLLLPGRLTLRQRAAWGLGPIVGVYAWALTASMLRGGGTPLVGFVPGNQFGINLWVPVVEHLGLEADRARSLSAMLAVAGGCIPLIVASRRGRRSDGRQLAALVAAMLCCVFALFYHVNPEYYIMAAPLLLLAAPARGEAGAVALLLSLPWAANFFYGVRNAVAAGAAEPGKGAFAKAYLSFAGPDPSFMYDITLSACILFTLALAVFATFRARRISLDV